MSYRLLAGSPSLRSASAIAALWGTLLGAPASAQAPPPHRLFRHFTQDNGLPSGVVFALAQDRDGFVWIGTAAGLARYGGRDFLTVGDMFGGGVIDLAVSPSGLLAALERGRLEAWVRRGDTFGRVSEPDGVPVRPVRAIAFDAGDTLWIVREDGALLRRAPDATWIPPQPPGAPRASAGAHGVPYGDRIWTGLFRGPGNGVLLAARSAGDRSALWLARGGRPPVVIAGDVPGTITAVAFQNDTMVLAAFEARGTGSIYRLRDGRLEPLESGPQRVTGLALRGGFLYVSDPTGLRRLTLDGVAQRIEGPAGVRSGSRLLVDPEGSMWLGTSEGVVQFPEPETATWSVDHGLTGPHGEYIAVSPDGVWFSAWQGLGLLERSATGWRGRNVQGAFEALAATRMCVDGDHVLWFQVGSTAHRYAVSSWQGGNLRHHASSTEAMDCDTGADGAVVVVAGDDVYRTAPARRLERIGPVPTHTSQWRELIAAGRDSVYVIRDPLLCAAGVDDLERRGLPAWSCTALPDIGETRDMLVAHDADGDELWVASYSGGVSRRVDGEWRPIEPLQPLSQRATNGLARSPAGGVWAYGFGFVVRLAQVDGRWRIAEQLGGWNGVEGDIRGLWEEPDGTIWLASWRGVTRVPASARTGPRAPLSTRLVALRVDGASLPPEDARIAADHHAIEIEFAARALRDPNRVRYRTRLDGVGWTDSPEPVFRVARIPTGDHVLEAAASPDGRMWGEPYRLAFRVESAWYARDEVFALAAALFVALGLLAHRLRTAHLLGLERQRMRIATDLHDELGAGLGSLGILGGIVAEGGVPAGAERQMGARIARTAGELGEALHDIVYSLRTGESRIEHLAEQLASRGRALFASNGTAFTTSFAHTGDGAIAPAVSRHVYRIAIEALHNAARHAGARNVRLAIGPAPVGRIRLDIRDDGRGIGADTLPEPDGMGLITMRQRAEAIGGTITIESGNGDGTRIVLLFDPRGPHGWRRRRPGGPS